MRMVLQLGPLPREWQALLEDMQRMNTDPQSEFNIPSYIVPLKSTACFYRTLRFLAGIIPHKRIEESFEARRKTIIAECQDADKYTRDEYSDYDVQSLKVLLRPMMELLRYEPEHRVSVQQAISYIEWVDYRNEM